MKDLTICIKTFERPKCLEECINSIRTFYPNVKIFVADDSEQPTYNNKADEYHFLPFDTGLSYGRNFLLDKVKTKFIMFIDDDTIFTSNECLEKMTSVLKNNQEIDLVAGSIIGNNFFGCLNKDGEILFRDQLKYRKITNGYKIYDYVLNLFVARTEKIKKIRWNNELKIVEHMDFFWRAKDKLISTRLDDCVFLNTSKRNSKYSKFRIDRIAFYKKKQCDLIGVKSIKDRR